MDYHNPHPHRHPPGTNFHGGNKLHAYKRVKVLGVPTSRCICGRWNCCDAQLEAINTERRLRGKT